MLDLQGLHRRLEEGNLDPKEVEIARAGHVCGKDGVEVEEIGRVEGWGGVDIKKYTFT